jgi:hypothetical protein
LEREFSPMIIYDTSAACATVFTRIPCSHNADYSHSAAQTQRS